MGPDTALLLVAEPEADAERLDQLAAMLAAEVTADADAEVSPVPAGAAPAGARGVDAAAAGALMVTLGQSGALGMLVDVVRKWLARSPSRGTGRSVKVRIGEDELELTDATPQVQEQVVAAFLARHEPATAS